MFVEATRMGGEGKITLTGQLGRQITDFLAFYQISEDKKTISLSPGRQCSKPLFKQGNPFRILRRISVINRSPK